MDQKWIEIGPNFDHSLIKIRPNSDQILIKIGHKIDLKWTLNKPKIEQFCFQKQNLLWNFLNYEIKSTFLTHCASLSRLFSFVKQETNYHTCCVKEQKWAKIEPKTESETGKIKLTVQVVHSKILWFMRAKNWLEVNFWVDQKCKQTWSQNQTKMPEKCQMTENMSKRGLVIY